MIDLGAKKCIPCKMMAPILAKLEKEYAGRAAIVFLDVWEDPKPAHRFAIRGIPTQIFFDQTGKGMVILGAMTPDQFREQMQALAGGQ